MPNRGMRLLLTLLLLGAPPLAGGCGGGPKEGDQVEVNKEQEKKVMEAMEDFYSKEEQAP